MKEKQTPESNEFIMNAVRADHRGRRVLAGIALAFGLLSVIASIALAAAYALMVQPKQKQLLMEYGSMARQAETNSVANIDSRTLPEGFRPKRLNAARAHISQPP